MIHDWVNNIVMKPLSYFFFADILEDPIKERVLRHFYDTLLKI